jgi:hypothetical protein
MGTTIDLSWEQVEELLPLIGEFDDDGLEHPKQFYGAPLSSVVGAGGVWLEDAIVAGYVPWVQSLGFALRARHALALAEIRRDKEDPENPLSDPEGTVNFHKQQYQRLADLLGGFVVELQQQP